MNGLDEITPAKIKGQNPPGIPASDLAVRRMRTGEFSGRFFLLPPFRPTLLCGLTEFPPGGCRVGPFPAIGLSRSLGECDSAALQSCDGAVESVTLGGQFGDDGCSVHGIPSFGWDLNG
jgi:hypothetical protein